MVSELFLSADICFRELIFCCWTFWRLGNKISYTFNKVFSLFTNRSNKLFRSWVVNSENLTFSLARFANLSKLSSNSLASSLFSSNLPIFFLPMISDLSLRLMTFLLTSSTQSTNRFSRSLFYRTSLTFLDFSWRNCFFRRSNLCLCSLILSL